MTFIPQVKPDSPFSWSNFPFGVFSTAESTSTHCATAIGDLILDLFLITKQDILQDTLVNDALAKVGCWRSEL